MSFLQTMVENTEQVIQRYYFEYGVLCFHVFKFDLKGSQQDTNLQSLVHNSLKSVKWLSSFQYKWEYNQHHPFEH